MHSNPSRKHLILSSCSKCYYHLSQSALDEKTPTDCRTMNLSLLPLLAVFPYKKLVEKSLFTQISLTSAKQTNDTIFLSTESHNSDVPQNSDNNGKGQNVWSDSEESDKQIKSTFNRNKLINTLHIHSDGGFFFVAGC